MGLGVGLGFGLKALGLELEASEANPFHERASLKARIRRKARRKDGLMPMLMCV